MESNSPNCDKRKEDKKIELGLKPGERVFPREWQNEENDQEDKTRPGLTARQITQKHGRNENGHQAAYARIDSHLDERIPLSVESK